MAKKHRQPTQQISRGNDANQTSLRPEEARDVRLQIEERHSKAALQLAKDLHKRCNCADSAALLAEAYRARIEDLIRLRMVVEARTLLAIVRERMPAAYTQMSSLEQEIQLLEGRLEQFVAPLADPALPAAERTRIEEFIRQRVDDLEVLANVKTLPEDHPVRSAAAALAKSFSAVTQGPVDEDVLALSAVSRRSPLASWKGLIRAIACYYRNENVECRRWMETIAADSVPARLLPSLKILLGETLGPLSGAKQTLVAAAANYNAVLRHEIETFEAAYKNGKPKPFLQAGRKVIEASRHLPAETQERLRQHLVIRCVLREVRSEDAYRAFGCRARIDAYYYRLLARALEHHGSDESVLTWARFRRAALHEKWFAEGSLEDGLLAQRLARRIEKMPPEVVEDLTDCEQDVSPDAQVNARQLLSSPEALWRRACQGDPSAESFQAWLDSAKKRGAQKNADEAAECWRKAAPGDVRPLLHLMESAEQRGAFKKSLGYLEEAEKLDRLNPAVGRARLRLLLAAAIRHLSQGKAHLARHEAEAISQLPQSSIRESATLAAAIGRCCAALERSTSEAEACERILRENCGPAGTHVLLFAVEEAAGVSGKLTFPALDAKSLTADQMLEQIARICQLGELAGLPTPMLFGWNSRLAAALLNSSAGLDAAQLLVLGEVALKGRASDLAHAASTAGLAGDVATARFLSLRGRSLPYFAASEKRGCMAAALELARRERDSELTGEILDCLNGSRGDYRWTPYASNAWTAQALPPELLGAILEEERKRKKFPTQSSYRDPRYGQALISHITVMNGPGSEMDGEDEDDWDESEEDEIPWDEPDLPPEAVRVFEGVAELFERLPPGSAERVSAAIKAGENPLDAIDRIVKETARKPSRAKTPPEGQGSLFDIF